MKCLTSEKTESPPKRNVQNQENCFHAEQRDHTRHSVNETETLSREM